MEKGQESSIRLQEKITNHSPSENPNPVLRIDKDGKICYANRAACLLLEYWGINEGEELPQSLNNDIKRTLSLKNPGYLEINTGKITYSLMLYACPEDNFADIYGFDISYRVWAEEELMSRNERLEKLVELKILEYIEVNEKLTKEVIERKNVEKTLRNNLHFLETLLESIPSPVFQRDLNEIYVNCNESFARKIMGLPKEKVIGRSFSEFQQRIPKELVDIYYKNDRELLDNGGIHHYETGGISADAVSRDFLIHKATNEDSSGKIAGIVGIMLEVTSSKEAEMFIRNSEELLRVAAERTGQIVFEHDHMENIIKWAGAIQDVTGYTVEEFNKFDYTSWADNIHPSDRKRALNELMVYQGKENKFRIEYRFRKKDGDYIHVEDSGVYQRNEDGNIRRSFGVMKDITGIKLASEKLKESETRYRSFMKNFRGIAFQTDLDSAPILVDGNIEEITGYNKEELISRKIDWYQIVHPQDRERYLENKVKLVKDPLVFIEQDYRIINKDGKIKWIHEIIQNVLDIMGKKRILQGAIYDVSKQKEAEESLAKVEETRKKEIHHRIKNNLQVISSLLELQAEKFNDLEVREAFHESQNRVATMAIIHEELYRSRNNETLDFSAYLQKLIAELFHSYIVRKGDVEMQLDIEDIFLGMDTAVPLGIIINELVSNSLKHAFPSDRRGKICIKLCRAEENSGNKSISNITNNIGAKSSVDKNIQYTLVVSDNGLGFPENIDFRSTDSLGLQLVNILVEQLEGTIEHESDSGTTFKIWFKDPYHSSENLSSIKGEIQ